MLLQVVVSGVVRLRWFFQPESRWWTCKRWEVRMWGVCDSAGRRVWRCCQQNSKMLQGQSTMLLPVDCGAVSRGRQCRHPKSRCYDRWAMVRLADVGMLKRRLTMVCKTQTVVLPSKSRDAACDGRRCSYIDVTRCFYPESGCCNLCRWCY